jgi:formylglycine-generating enzyme required for sulfatase activity
MIRLPTEQEWQRAALDDHDWQYPWGNALDETRGNYGKNIGQPSHVGRYPGGKSQFGVLDMIGNVWERCLTGWNQEILDIRGYTYRVFRGGAWNVSNPEYLRANDRACHPPRGQLNDCGFRVLLAPGLQSQKAA